MPKYYPAKIMQETMTTHVNPETRSIECINGGTDDAGRQAIVAEEQTHAAEILFNVTGRGIVPRDYRLENGEISSEYGANLKEIFEFGIADAEAKVECGIPGASKELRRRQIERNNLDKIANLPVGFAMVEWSLADMTWTSEERKLHGYNGATMARITARTGDASFKQLNIILKSSDLSVINRCRTFVEPDVQEIWNAEEMLAEPQVVGIGNGNILDLSRQIETEYVRATIDDTARGLVKGAVRRAIIHRKVMKELNKVNSWDYVTGQGDVFEALVQSFTTASRLRSEDWQNAASIARGGAWNKLIERYQGKDVSKNKVTDEREILSSAKRAAAADFVFTACGGSIDMKSLIPGSSSQLERIMTVMTLLGNVVGLGACNSCGATGSLFGCGVYCRRCNQVWCDEYLLTGRQLQDNEITFRKSFQFLEYSRV